MLYFDSWKPNSSVMGTNKGVLLSREVAYSFTTERRRTSASSTNTRFQWAWTSSINHNDFMNWTDLETKITTRKNRLSRVMTLKISGRNSKMNKGKRLNTPVYLLSVARENHFILSTNLSISIASYNF